MVFDGVGVPQGGILSPLLSNVILHELDLFVVGLINRQNELVKDVPLGKVRPEYTKLTREIGKVRRAMGQRGDLGNMWGAERAKLKTLKKLIRKRNGTSRLTEHPVKFEYVRYADDWLIGVWGPVSLVKELKEKIRIFLVSLKLELSPSKTLITRLFLGKLSSWVRSFV